MWERDFQEGKVTEVVEVKYNESDQNTCYKCVILKNN